MYQLELARIGEPLFKVRGHYLTAIVLIGVAVAYDSRMTGPFATDGANEAWFALSFAIAAAGALVRIITSGYAALGTSGNSKDVPKAAELNTTGPYSLVRNPLYFGRILNFTGIAMLSGSWVYGALVLLLSVLVYERVATFEEEFLRKQFGAAHAKWAAEVPFLLPRLHGWVKPKYPFWVRRCIRREDKKLFLFATALMLYDFARIGFDHHQVDDDPLWFGVWAVVALSSLIIMILRHFTKTFDGVS